MNPRRALAGVIVLCFCALVLVVFYSSRPSTKLIANDDFEGVIFSRKAAERALESMLLNDPSGYWAPTRNDVLELERRLHAHVLQAHPDIEPKLSAYRRQYFGFTRHQTRRILVVGFCSVEELDWSREFVSIAESGDCHFEAEYDVATATFSSFWILDG